MANVDPILRAGLECMATCACELELCTAEPQTHADVERMGLACKEAVPLSLPYHRIPTGMAIKIKAFSDGKCERNGRVTHWALCGPDQLWATGPLASPIEVFAGALFEFPELTINLPGAP